MTERDPKIEALLAEAMKEGGGVVPEGKGAEYPNPGPWLFRRILDAFPELRPAKDPWDAVFVTYMAGLYVSTTLMGDERTKTPPPVVILGLLQTAISPPRLSLEPECYPDGHPDKEA